MVSWHFNQSEKSHDQKYVFEKGVVSQHDNLKSTSPVHLKFGKYICYIDIWKSLTLESDPIQSGQLINHELSTTILLHAENKQSLISQKRCEIEQF